MPTESTALLSWAYLTGLVDERKKPNRFLRDKFYGVHETLPTDKIEVGKLTAARTIAPFVRKHGEALQIAAPDETAKTYEAPNIRIKIPTPPSVIYQRPAGIALEADNADQMRANFDAKLLRHLGTMDDVVLNAEEWLAAMAFRGVVSYAVSGEENFQITFGRANANSYALTTGWNDIDPQQPTPEEDFHTAKKILHDAVGMPLTDAVMGETAALYFRRLVKAQNGLDKLWVDAGRIDLNGQFDAQGALFMGRFCGVNCWEYSRAGVLGGVSTPMIRAEYVEFIAGGAEAERILYYGSIADIDAIKSGQFQGERFAKQWSTPEPSVLWSLLASRPFACPRRPDASVSVDVIL